MLESLSPVVIVAPHTDDGELGCGGTIAKLAETKGVEVYYVALSSCDGVVPAGFDDDVLKREVRAATRVLGIPPDRLMLKSFVVRNFAQDRQDILDVLVELNRQLSPGVVFMPALSDLHQDHSVVSAEGLRAFKGTTILAYEMPWNNLSFQTQCFIPPEKRHVEVKIAALKCYESQSDRAYIQPEYVRAHLLMRGQQVRLPYAECFEVVRWILR
jgi:LmbE family N-acetylglucosaminyl deacetylase